MFRNIKVMLIVLVVLVIAGGAYGFAAANTVAPSAGGYSANVVSGYTVTDIKYDLNATDPTKVDKILFDVSPTSGTVVAAIVKVQTATGGNWTDCTLVAGEAPLVAATCTFADPILTFANVTALNIVASSSIDPAP
jgi:hypothetical protein